MINVQQWQEYHNTWVNSTLIKLGINTFVHYQCEEKEATATINLMDGRTIPYIEDVGAFMTDDPSYHLEVRKWKVTFVVMKIRR